MNIRIDLLEIGISLCDQVNEYNRWEAIFIMESYKRKKIKITQRYAREIYKHILSLKIKPISVPPNKEQESYAPKKTGKYDLISSEESFEEYFVRVKNYAIISETIELYKQAIERYESKHNTKTYLIIPTQFPDYLLNDSDYDRRIPTNVKQFVWKRAGGKCEICGSEKDLEFDHDIPVSKGGSNSEKNIQILCRKCNRKKKDKIE